MVPVDIVAARTSVTDVPDGALERFAQEKELSGLGGVVGAGVEALALRSRRGPAATQDRGNDQESSEKWESGIHWVPPATCGRPAIASGPAASLIYLEWVAAVRDPLFMGCAKEPLPLRARLV
jgi:hypothetical protein